MKKLFSLALSLLCILGLVGCNRQKTESISYHSIDLTIPAGSSEIVYASELDYFKDGKVTVSAAYDSDDNSTLEVCFQEENSAEGSYASVEVPLDSTAEITLNGETWYEIGVRLNNTSSADIPVTLTLYDESWKQ